MVSPHCSNFLDAVPHRPREIKATVEQAKGNPIELKVGIVSKAPLPYHDWTDSIGKSQLSPPGKNDHEIIPPVGTDQGTTEGGQLLSCEGCGGSVRAEVVGFQLTTRRVKWFTLLSTLNADNGIYSEHVRLLVYSNLDEKMRTDPTKPASPHR